jgi:hypothetical protein
MAVAKFIPHLRNEHVLHRWDVVGEDDISRQLQGSDDLVDHSVGELEQILLVAGRKHDPDPDTNFGVRLRSDGHRDLRVLVEAGTCKCMGARQLEHLASTLTQDEATPEIGAANDVPSVDQR